MKKLIILALFLSLGACPPLHAQFSGGFIAGVNLSRFDGPPERNAQGEALEEYQFSTGFHLGARFKYRFNQYFSLQSELLFSQKGSEFRFDGPSYWVFIIDEQTREVSTGNRNTSLSITNNYIEIPLMAAARLGRLELTGGAYAAVLVTSRAEGQLTYSGVTPAGAEVPPFSVELEFNFFDEDAEPSGFDDTFSVQASNGQIFELPRSIGSEYEPVIGEDADDPYRRFDYGLVGGLSLYLNQGLFVGLRANYGLSDLSEDNRDISRVSLDENDQAILREDDDRNLTLQLSIGFSF